MLLQVDNFYVCTLTSNAIHLEPEFFGNILLLYRRDEIEKLENIIAEYKEKLQETCGDEEYDTLKENLHNGIEKAKRFVQDSWQTV